MILRARLLVTMDGPPITDGAVLVRDGLIEAVGPWARIAAQHPGEALVDLGEKVLLPGLINAHCHLDYTMMRRAINPQATFARWVERINALKRSLSEEDYLAAIANGFAELEKWGTTSVLNIESFPELMHRLPTPPIRTWWCYELIDVRHRLPTDAMVAGALFFFTPRPDWLGGFGLSPHAPYTASPELYRLAGECGRKLDLPVTTHVAESRDEYRMFRSAEGPLYDFLSGLGRPMEDCRGKSPFQTLLHEGAIGPGWILAHLNELDEEDLAILSTHEHCANFHVVHCPQSHAYFQHAPFAFRRLHEAGVNLCLGTDSLASGDSLNLFTELQTVRDAHPWLPAEELLRTVTVNPARALGMAGRLGQIVPGACADLIALPCPAGPDEIFTEIVGWATPVHWRMIDGRIRA